MIRVTVLDQFACANAPTSQPSVPRRSTQFWGPIRSVAFALQPDTLDSDLCLGELPEWWKNAAPTNLEAVRQLVQRCAEKLSNAQRDSLTQCASPA